MAFLIYMVRVFGMVYFFSFVCFRGAFEKSMAELTVSSDSKQVNVSSERDITENDYRNFDGEFVY